MEENTISMDATTSNMHPRQPPDQMSHQRCSVQNSQNAKQQKIQPAHDSKYPPLGKNCLIHFCIRLIPVPGLLLYTHAGSAPSSFSLYMIVNLNENMRDGKTRFSSRQLPIPPIEQGRCLRSRWELTILNVKIYSSRTHNSFHGLV